MPAFLIFVYIICMGSPTPTQQSYHYCIRVKESQNNQTTSDNNMRSRAQCRHKQREKEEEDKVRSLAFLSLPRPARGLWSANPDRQPPTCGIWLGHTSGCQTNVTYARPGLLVGPQLPGSRPASHRQPDSPLLVANSP